jgi:hypothetical protein
MKRLFASFCSLSLVPVFSFCQSTTTPTSLSSGTNGAHGTMSYGTTHFNPPFYRVVPIAGAPFSAEEVEQHEQTLADGTHINRAIAGMKIYRDSMGRTRTERSLAGPVRNPNLPEAPTIVEINDPIARVSYVFTLSEAVAHRRKLPKSNSRIASSGHEFLTSPPSRPTGQGDNGVAASTNAGTTGSQPTTRPRVDDGNRMQTTTEDLGTQVIEGISAEGKRHTTTFPVGWMGNDRPITSISETWTSPDLKEVIVRKLEDPRMGENIHRLINISRSEPDPSLFAPPPNYTIEDEKKEFSLKW